MKVLTYINFYFSLSQFSAENVAPEIIPIIIFLSADDTLELF